MNEMNEMNEDYGYSYFSFGNGVRDPQRGSQPLSTEGALRGESPCITNSNSSGDLKSPSELVIGRPSALRPEGDRRSPEEFEYKHKDKPHEAIHSMIEWHDDITRVNVNSVVLNAHHFGILRISAPKTPISTTPLAILLNIDGSSSMDEIGSGKLTKINHIKHTLKNMIYVLIDKITETPNICIYISILLFTHDVTNLLQRIKTEKQFGQRASVPSSLLTTNTEGDLRSPEKFEQFKDDFILLNHQSMHLILEEIDRIRPWGCTNIEISLKNAKTKINDLKTKNPNFRIAHIQLTDGQATAGKKHADELSSYVDTSYRNIFVGYGEEHDSHLLASLGEIYPTCDYRFIDNIERTGMVYGEIMYHLLYPHNDEPILIQMSPGTKIYNWKTNQWSSTLTIPPLSSDTEKVFQIIIDDLNISKEDVWADLYYTNNIQIPIETAITLPSLITLPIKIPGATYSEKYESPEEFGEKLPINLTKYLLRQLTQECLYLVRYHELNNDDTMYSPPPPLIRSTNQVSSYPPPPPLIRSTNHVSSYPTIDELKDKLSSNINLLLSHRDELTQEVAKLPCQNTDDDDDVLFIQTLIDDLQTALTNLGSTQSFMYTAARQTSQGSQHTYSPYNTRYNDRPFGFQSPMQASLAPDLVANRHSGRRAEGLPITNSEGDLRSPEEFAPYQTGSGEHANPPDLRSYRFAETSGRRDTTNTFDLYNHDIVQHNHSHTSYTNSNILDMMTQVQGMDNSMYVSNFSGDFVALEVSSEEAGSLLPDVENDISDSLDNLSQEPVVHNTHVHIPFPYMPPNSSGDHRSPSELVVRRHSALLPNSSGDYVAYRVSSEEAFSPLPNFSGSEVSSEGGFQPPLPRIRTNSVNSESTVSVFTQLMDDYITDED